MPLHSAKNYEQLQFYVWKRALGKNICEKKLQAGTITMITPVKGLILNLLESHNFLELKTKVIRLKRKLK